MKFRITFKDPDVVERAIADAIRSWVDGLGLTDKKERALMEARRRESELEKVAKWFKFCESVTIEIDTDADTATVVSKP